MLCDVGSQHFEGPLCIIQGDKDCMTAEDDGITVFWHIWNHLSKDAASLLIRPLSFPLPL